MQDFLFRQHEEGVAAFDTNAVQLFVEGIEREKLLGAPLTAYGRIRLARDLLRMAAAFGLVKGQPLRRFAQVTIPDDALLYALYSLQGELPSVSRALQSRKWRLFLLTPSAVERELLNLHQFRRVRYDHAGSIRELSLPYKSVQEFARSLTL